MIACTSALLLSTTSALLTTSCPSSRRVVLTTVGAATDRLADGYNRKNQQRQQRDNEYYRGTSRTSGGKNVNNRGRDYNDGIAFSGGVSERHPRRREQLNDDEPKPEIYAFYLATCLPGMAGILQDELISLGCVAVELSGKSAVHFGVPDLQSILRVLLWTRTAHKLMELLTTTQEPVHTRDDVYQFVCDTIPVMDLLGSSDDAKDWLTVSVSVTLNNAKHIPDDINHSHYTALNVKNALVDAARVASKDDSRPSVDTTNPDVPLAVVLRGLPSTTRIYESTSTDDRRNNAAVDHFTSAGAHMSIYRCIHTGSLHRRGYRYGTAVHKAAMKESTASGLLLAAGWHLKCQSNDNVVLIDPMMGSGTFLVEGAMIAADLAPGLMRLKCGVPASLNPPILRWNHDGISAPDLEAVWNELLMEATTRAKKGLESIQGRVQIIGNDIHGGAYDLADRALRQAGLSKAVQLHCQDCLNLPIPETSKASWMVASNPPWGVRLTDGMHESWEALRVFLRERCPAGSEAWILSGSPEATKHLGLRRSQSFPLQTGDQDLRWLQYSIRDKSDAATASYREKSEAAVATLKMSYEKRPPRSRDYVQSRAPRPSTGVKGEKSKRTPSKAPRTKPVDNEWFI